LNQARKTATAPASILRECEYLNRTGAINAMVDMYRTHSRRLFGSRKYRTRYNIDIYKLLKIP
jgi:hypothetical protein